MLPQNAGGKAMIKSLSDGLELVYKDSHALSHARKALDAVMNGALVSVGGYTDSIGYKISNIVGIEPRNAIEVMEVVEFWKASARLETTTERRYRIFSEITDHPNIVIECPDYFRDVFTELANMSEKSEETLLSIFDSWLSGVEAQKEKVLTIYKDFVPLSFGFSLRKMVLDKEANAPVMKSIFHGGIILHKEFGEPEWSQHT